MTNVVTGGLTLLIWSPRRIKRVFPLVKVLKMFSTGRRTCVMFSPVLKLSEYQFGWERLKTGSGQVKRITHKPNLTMWEGIIYPAGKSQERIQIWPEKIRVHTILHFSSVNSADYRRMKHNVPFSSSSPRTVARVPNCEKCTENKGPLRSWP